MLKPARGCAVYINNALTRFGVRLGFACSISAAVPAATGVAIEVPLRYIILRLSEPLTPASSEGVCVTRQLLSASASISLFPGAIRSGLIRLSKWLTPRSEEHTSEL